MKLYRTKSFADPGVDSAIEYSWQGTQADAAAERKRLKAEFHSGIETAEIDVPTDKPSLLAWLNVNVTGPASGE